MDNIENVQKYVRRYLTVFGALAVLTVITVGASFLQVGIITAITIAMIIAATKGSLVVGVFMHLITEKKLVFIVLSLTLFLFLVLMFITLFTFGNQVGIHVS
ncbi:MAG: cytochrome C oxidase subunit IV family protein [Fidelibacterota bacterium]